MLLGNETSYQRCDCTKAYSFFFFFLSVLLVHYGRQLFSSVYERFPVVCVRFSVLYVRELHFIGVYAS